MASLKSTVQSTFASPWVRAVAAFAVVAIGASWLVVGTPPKVEGDRLTFSGVDLEGQPVSLLDKRFAGKVVLVDIWGTWCPPCQMTIPILIDLQKRYGSQGFAVIGVEFADGFTTTREDYIEFLRAWVKDKGINYTVVQAGTTGEVYRFFPNMDHFEVYPTAIIIGRDGRVRSIEGGYRPGIEDVYEAQIQKLVLDRVPAPQQ